MIKNKIVISFLLIIIGITFRLLPHAWNFTPIVAITLFAGVYLGGRYVFILPLIIMILSDLLLGFYEPALMIAVYSSYALIGLLSLLLKKYKSGETIIAATIIASVLFFVLTNYAVWQFSPWYAKTFSGLIECYALALPFFKNSLLGNVFYASLFFGAYEYAKYFASRENTSIVLKRIKG